MRAAGSLRQREICAGFLLSRTNDEEVIKTTSKMTDNETAQVLAHEAEAHVMDGTDGCLRTLAADLTSSFTIMLAVRPTFGACGGQHMLMLGGTGFDGLDLHSQKTSRILGLAFRKFKGATDYHPFFSFFGNDAPSRPSFAAFEAGRTASPPSVGRIVPNEQWSHVAFVYSKPLRCMEIYVNGELSIRETHKAPFRGTQTSIGLGHSVWADDRANKKDTAGWWSSPRYADAEATRFHGSIAHAHASSRACSSAEVWQVAQTSLVRLEGTSSSGDGDDGPSAATPAALPAAATAAPQPAPASIFTMGEVGAAFSAPAPAPAPPGGADGGGAGGCGGGGGGHHHAEDWRGSEGASPWRRGRGRTSRGGVDGAAVFHTALRGDRQITARPAKPDPFGGARPREAVLCQRALEKQ